MRRVPAAVLLLLLSLPAFPGADAVSARVVVFRGRGLGHGVGMPLDGANVMALRDDDVDAGDVLGRFYPGLGRGSGSGIVRVLVAASEEPREGLVVRLPQGGAIRDGRTTAVAPSFPINVEAGRRVKVTFDEGRYRAEVLDDSSVSGTRTLEEAEEATRRARQASGSESEEFPGLGASASTLWIEPRAEGAIEVGGGRGRAFRGLFEVVLAARRLHLVSEIDVEDYLKGLDPRPPAGPPLEPPVVEAVVVAARSYALRAARGEMRVGRFHLFADERSNRYAGEEEAPAGLVRAVEETEGEILTDGGEPAAALVTVSAGGVTAGAAEVFGEEFPYLESGEYETDRPFEWRVDMDLDEVASRLGYPGRAEGLSVSEVGGSGRPLTLTLRGSEGDETVEAVRFHEALGLPSTWFEATVQLRAAPVGPRDESPPFQQLPRPPLEADVAAAEGGGGGGVSPVYVLVALGALALVVAVALVVRGRGRNALRVTPGPSPPAGPRPTVRWENEPEWLDDLLRDRDPD